MNIQTKEFKISEAEFRQISKILYYKSRKIIIIMVAWCLLVNVIFLMLSPGNYLLAIFFIFELGLHLIYPFITNNLERKSNINFQNKNCEINENYLTINYEDGSLLKLNFNNFISVRRTSEYYFMTYNDGSLSKFDNQVIQIVRASEYYFMYVTKMNFLYLPVRAFNSKNDISNFNTLMINKNLIK